MASCSCAGATCNCVLTPGSGVGISGAGTPSNPYVISSDAGGVGGGARLPGEIVAYAGSSAPPGWLVCNGQAVSRAAYPNLFAAIGTSWSTGSDQAMFNVPNLIDRFPYGASQNRPLGTSGGAPTATLTSGQLPPHTHNTGHNHAINHDHGSVTTSGSNVGIRAAPYAKHVASGGDVADSNTYTHTHTVNLPNYVGTSGAANPAVSGSTGSGTAVPIIPPYAAMNFLIKT